MTRVSAHEHVSRPTQRTTECERGILAHCRTSLLSAHAPIPGVGPAFTQRDRADLRIMHQPYRRGAPALYTKASIAGRNLLDCTIVADYTTKRVRFVTQQGWYFEIRLSRWEELLIAATLAHGAPLDLGVTAVASSPKKTGECY